MTAQPHLTRIRLLSSRFYELQGLRVALTGACISLVVGGYIVAAPHPTNNGAMLALLISFAPVIPGVWWLNRYYAATFGRQVWRPPRHAPLVMLGFYVVAASVNTWIPEIPAGAPTMAVVAVASMWVAIRDWPHRAYYLGATAAVVTGFAATASGAGLLAPNLTLGTMFLLIGASLVPIGLLDHLLLIKLMREARESQHAERAGI
jgi:hypothetical protein